MPQLFRLFLFKSFLYQDGAQVVGATAQADATSDAGYWLGLLLFGWLFKRLMGTHTSSLG
jgi:hypothetical protein